jgi:hypothetical protein
MRTTRGAAVALLLCIGGTGAAAAQSGPGAQGKSPGVKAADPAKMPLKATARCNDNTWSLAASENGACSSHGGVAQWFGHRPRNATARCKDGTYWIPTARRGTCSGRGGVVYWLEKPKPKPN